MTNFLGNLKIKVLSFWAVAVLVGFTGLTVFSIYYVSLQASTVRDHWKQFIVGPHEKIAILSDLRNALGYGGMIHHFKNFVLRQDRSLVLAVEKDILKITVLLTAYENIGLNDLERAAIDVLDGRLTKYKEAMVTAEKMARDGRSSREIDAAIRINDDLALSAMLSIVGQLEQAHVAASRVTDEKIEKTNEVSNIFIVVIMLGSAVSIGFVFWFLNARILGPMRVLGDAMEVISFKGPSHPVPFTGQSDEIGDMARTVEVFRKVMEERKKFESMLVEAKEISDSASEAKTEFLNNMSHELRTPLNGILGLSEMMREQTFGPIGNEKYADYIDEIHKSGRHLLELVENILDVSEIDAKKILLEDSVVALNSMVDDCIGEMSADAEEKNILMRNQTPGVPVKLRMDAPRIKKVLLNLLSNAVKFTPENGNVSVDTFHEKDGCIALSVTDTGIGMAPESLEKALSPFGQIDRGTFVRHEGTGLGLYLCRLLVEMHGGDLRIKSGKNAGTRVTIRFPKNRIVT